MELLPEFVIGGYNLNKIRYADDAVLIADNGKMQRLLQKVVNESEKKDLNVNWKKTDCMVKK